MTPGYNYHTADGQVRHQPNDNSKAKEYCGCGAVGNRVVHGRPDEPAWLMCEACLQRLTKIVAGGL